MSNDESKNLDKPSTNEDVINDPSRRQFLSSSAQVSGLAGGLLLAPGTALMAATDMHQGHTMKNQSGVKGSMMFDKGHHVADGQVIDVGGLSIPADDEVSYKSFDISVSIIQHEIVPGVKAHFFAFNEQIPGPEFHVEEGDWVKVNFTNKTEAMHTMHWHGLTVPNLMDGVPMVTQDPVHPGQTYVYRFQAKPAGTRWYHCHWGTPLHATHAMHGAFIIHKKKESLKKRFPYSRDYTLCLQAWDLNLLREEMNDLHRGMKQVNQLSALGELDSRTHGFFKSYEAFTDAVENGSYIPPYLNSRNTMKEFKPNFFAINGKSYPATKKLFIKEGEWIRVRFINTNGLGHHMHLHGHDFWWVAQDGNELDRPRKLNTIHVEAGGTYDIMIFGDNPGNWTMHDHNTQHVRNNGVYPGGMLTMLSYEDFESPYTPSVSVEQ